MFQGPSDRGLPERTHNVDMDMSFRELMVSALAGVSRPQNISSSHSTQESGVFSSSTDHNASRGHHSMALDPILGRISLVLSGMTGTQNTSSLLSPQFENNFSFTKSLSQSLSVHDYSLGYTPRQPAQMPLHDPGNKYIQSSSSGLNPAHVLAEEIKKINIKLAELQVAHEQLALKIVKCLQCKSQSKSASAAKNISNQHPKLKPILHKKVLEMCGVDMLGQADHLKTLAQYQHGLPDQWPSEEVNGRIVWRPVWSEHVDHTVNICFLHSIMDGIMEDEKAKGELDNNDYVSTTVMMMAKSYWRTLASDIRAMADPQGQAKRKDRISDKCHRSRWGQIAHRHRGAMEEFEKKFGVQGVAAMIDSDFGLDNQTIDEESLSEDMNMRRKEQDVPMNGWKRVGLTWQSLDVCPISHLALML
ncbi:hypothetical protein EDC04DRAFT_2601437 [Pisolithus marmoratus]|nr:hypothetical protein EDC04DRAFT_2601437 [Pisolithus marmoratus]